MVYFLSGVSQMEYDWAECLRGLLDPCSRERLDTMKHPGGAPKIPFGSGAFALWACAGRRELAACRP